MFSGIKGRSAFGNAIYHINCKYMLKLDMSKFFPNTHRNNIYEFFKDKLKMSSDVSSICTDIVTVNYEKEDVEIDYEVYDSPNRVMITCDWGKKQVATVKSDTQVRYRGGVKSPIVTDVKKKDEVIVLENEQNWK